VREWSENLHHLGPHTEKSENAFTGKRRDTRWIIRGKCLRLGRVKKSADGNGGTKDVKGGEGRIPKFSQKKHREIDLARHRKERKRRTERKNTNNGWGN